MQINVIPIFWNNSSPVQDGMLGAFHIPDSGCLFVDFIPDDAGPPLISYYSYRLWTTYAPVSWSQYYAILLVFFMYSLFLYLNSAYQLWIMHMSVGWFKNYAIHMSIFAFVYYY